MQPSPNTGSPLRPVSPVAIPGRSNSFQSAASSSMSSSSHVSLLGGAHEAAASASALPELGVGVVGQPMPLSPSKPNLTIVTATSPGHARCATSHKLSRPLRLAASPKIRAKLKSPPLTARSTASSNSSTGSGQGGGSHKSAEQSYKAAGPLKPPRPTQPTRKPLKLPSPGKALRSNRQSLQLGPAPLSAKRHVRSQSGPAPSSGQEERLGTPPSVVAERRIVQWKKKQQEHEKARVDEKEQHQLLKRQRQDDKEQRRREIYAKNQVMRQWEELRMQALADAGKAAAGAV